MSLRNVDWNSMSIKGAGPRVARKEAAKLNGPTGNGFPRIGKVTVSAPTKRALTVQKYNVEAINLPRVAEPLAAIRPHFVSTGSVFRSARATPPAGSGFRVVEVGMCGVVMR